LTDEKAVVVCTGTSSLPSRHTRRRKLLQRQGNLEGAEKPYRRAPGIAAKQGAKLSELCATVSLARLLRDQGKRNAARDLLAPIHAWFTEGFDTPDLKDACVEQTIAKLGLPAHRTARSPASRRSELPIARRKVTAQRGSAFGPAKAGEN
jgi:hypothetical protein